MGMMKGVRVVVIRCDDACDDVKGEGMGVVATVENERV